MGKPLSQLELSPFYVALKALGGRWSPPPFWIAHAICAAVLLAQATLRPENSQMTTVINPTRPASPSDLVSAMMLSVTLLKNGN